MTKRRESLGRKESSNAPTVKEINASAKNRPFHFILGSIEISACLAKSKLVINADKIAKMVKTMRIGVLFP